VHVGEDLNFVGWRFKSVGGDFECWSFEFVGGSLNVGALNLLKEI